jgi:TPR repeat protein
MRRIFLALAALLVSAATAAAQYVTPEEVESARQDYLTGRFDTAFAVLLPAAEQGDLVAQNIVGIGHQYGEGLPVDAKGAVRWFTASGEGGFAAAWHNLGYLHEVGMPGLAPDDVLARDFYRRAIDLDYVPSMANLGTLLREGRGGPIDIMGAIDLYRQGATGGDGAAMDAMGWMYLNGIGVAADDAEARNWYLRSAGAGYPQGIGNLGYMLDSGRGGPRDLKQARTNYQRAIDLGHLQSAVNMAWMIHENPDSFRDQTEGLAWCLWALDRASPAQTANWQPGCDTIASRLSPTTLTEARAMADRL